MKTRNLLLLTGSLLVAPAVSFAQDTAVKIQFLKPKK